MLKESKSAKVAITIEQLSNCSCILTDSVYVHKNKIKLIKLMMVMMMMGDDKCT